MYGLRGTYDVPLPPGFVVQPGNLTAADQMQAEIDALYAYTGAGQGQSTSQYQNTVGQPYTPGIMSFLNDNAGKIMIGAGAFVALMLFAKAGR